MNQNRKTKRSKGQKVGFGQLSTSKKWVPIHVHFGGSDSEEIIHAPWFENPGSPVETVTLLQVSLSITFCRLSGKARWVAPFLVFVSPSSFFFAGGSPVGGFSRKNGHPLPPFSGGGGGGEGGGFPDKPIQPIRVPHISGCPLLLGQFMPHPMEKP